MGDAHDIEDGGLDSLTEMQRAILDALQRPLRDGGPYATPATNKEIAAEVHLSVDAVKGHLRAIYARLGLEDLPQNAKRARLAEIGLSGALEHTLPPRPPEPVAAVAVAPARRQRGRLPAMLVAVALGLVLAGLVTGLMLGRDEGDTFISQSPGYDDLLEPGAGGSDAPFDLPGPSSPNGLFASGPAVPVAAGVPLDEASPGRRQRSRRPASRERGSVRGESRRRAAPRQAGSTPPAAPATTTATAPEARRTCTTRRQVTYRPVTVTVRRVRLKPQQVRKRVVRYRREVKMVPVQREVPNGNGKHKGNGKRRNRDGNQGNNGGGTHTETVYVRQVRRVPYVTYVTRTRMRRQVRYVKVTRRQRQVRMVRTCR